MSAAIDLQPRAPEWVSVRDLSRRSGVALRTLQRYAERWRVTGAVAVRREKLPGTLRWCLWIDAAGAAARLGVTLR